jgi:fibronectin-binding autotransporter adhesin
MPKRDSLNRSLAAAASGLVIALLAVVPSPTLAAITIDCAHASLQTALNSAPPGATLNVKGTCSGNFAFSKNLTLSGSPAATLDGAGTGTTLTINGFHRVTLTHLVVTNGVGPDGGGIRFSGGGSLSIDHVRVNGNSAVGGLRPQSAGGGGIFVRDPAFVTITNSTISGNHVTTSGHNAQSGQGGGVYAIGELTLVNTTVTGNTILATSDDNSGNGMGGGIFVEGALAVSGSTIEGNHATGTGAQFGSAYGAGVSWSPFGNDALRIAHSTISSNVAKGTAPADARASGAGLYLYSGYSSPATISDSTLDGNRAIANASAGNATVYGGAIDGEAHYSDANVTLLRTKVINSFANAVATAAADGYGGGIKVAGTTVLDHVTLSSNRLHVHAGSGLAQGGGGGANLYTTSKSSVVASTVADNIAIVKSDQTASAGRGGGLYVQGVSPIAFRLSTISGNLMQAIANNASSEADGGGVALAGTNANPGDSFSNTTIASNQAVSVASTGPTAAGAGLAVFDKHLHMTFTTVARNSTSTTGSSPIAGGGGMYLETGTSNLLFANLIVANTATTGPDCLGNATSDGFNLFTNRSGCTLNTVIGDQTTATPKVGGLAQNGGPTKTIALLAGSPALDQVSTQGCHTAVTRDQRGVVRPQGPKCDIGAYEKKP